MNSIPPILLLAAAGCAPQPRGHHPEPAQVQLHVAALAREYRELRPIRGHFRGGEWNDAVDAFGGRKHVVMNAIHDELAGVTLSRRELIGLLGEPDAVETIDGRSRLIYFWRGWHDYLHFNCDDVSVCDTGWYHAYE